MKHPCSGWTATFGKPEPARDLLDSIISRFGKVRFRSFLEPEDALNFLARQDPEVAEALEVASGIELAEGLLPV